MANPLTVSSLNLANFTHKDIWKKNIRDGILARLATSDPELMVGNTDIYTFTQTPKAELVGEGGDKSSADFNPVKVTAKTYKVQFTYRYSDEIKYADADYQLRILDALAGNIMTGLSRAVDLIAIHGVNPLTGTVADGVVNYFNKADNGVASVTETANANADVMALAGKLQEEGYNADGIAFDPAYAGKLARTLGTDGRQIYPELGLGFNVESFQGLRAASSDTVSGKSEIATLANRPQAIMGDFDAFKWGISANVPLHLIEYGDPDGQGDLQRKNQVAIRAEAYISFAILDGKAFAMVKAAE